MPGGTTVQAECPSAERENLQQPARHRQVLHEVEQLVLVTQRAVKDQGRDDTEDRRTVRMPRGLSADDWQGPAELKGWRLEVVGDELPPGAPSFSGQSS
jgi:hypothetical protein